MSSLDVITATDILRALKSLPDLVGAIDRSGADFCTIARAVRTGDTLGADFAIAAVGVEVGLTPQAVMAARSLPELPAGVLRKQHLEKRRTGAAKLARSANMRNIAGVPERFWRLRNAAGLDIDETAEIMEASPDWLRQLEAGQLTEIEMPVQGLVCFGRYIEISFDVVVDEHRSSQTERGLFTDLLETAEDRAVETLVRVAPSANVAEYRLIKTDIEGRFSRFIATAGPRGHNRATEFRLTDADLMQMWVHARRKTKGDNA